MKWTRDPALTPEVLHRLEQYAAGFRAAFNRPRQATWFGFYLRGLIQHGGRKSAEPMAARVPLPPGLDVADPEQALQQFLAQSSWDERAILRRYRATMAARFADRDGIFVIGDTAFPKKGGHSVGVGRQDCGAPGIQANCQCAVSLHYVSRKGQYPLDLRLCLPDSWLDDPARLDSAGVPEAERRRLTRGEIALELLDRVRGEGLECRVVVAPRGYGDSRPFRDGLAERRLHYLVGVGEGTLVVADRRRDRHRPAEGPDRPESLKDLAVGARWLRMDGLRSWTDEPMSGRSAWLPVRAVPGWSTAPSAGAEPSGLLIMEEDDGELEYAFSDLQEGDHTRAVYGWRGRRWMEQDYRRMRGELGLDHHEGRSWRGFHHHACLVMLAYGFLALEALEPPPARRGRSRPGK